MRKSFPVGLAVFGSVLTIAIVAAPSVATPSGPSQQATPVTRVNGTVVATDLSARLLASDPVLVRGDRVVITVAGFAAGQPVRMWLVDDSGGALGEPAVVSDNDGNVHLVYSVPAASSAGPHLLVLSGPGPNRAASTIESQSTVIATVPNTGLFHYVVAP